MKYIVDCWCVSLVGKDQVERTKVFDNETSARQYAVDHWDDELAHAPAIWQM